VLCCTQDGYDYAAVDEAAANALPMVDLVLAVQDPVDVCILLQLYLALFAVVCFVDAHLVG
jgi:hypothetical protein